MTATLPKGTLCSVASLLATTLYQGNPDMNHNIVLTVSVMTDLYAQILTAQYT